MSPYKPRIVIDFDGVLHSYTSGWQGADQVPDPPTPGAQAFVQGVLDAGWDVAICSTRAETGRGASAIYVWLMEWGFPLAVCESEKICHGKPSALVYLDDRALRFDGNWPSLEAIQTAAVPWNKPHTEQA